MLAADVVELVALGAGLLALVALTAVVVLLGRLTRLQHGVEGLVGDRFVAELEAAQRTAAALTAEVDRLRGDLAATRADLAGALRHVAVVRYDAFGDMGGRLSFTAALLDDGGDGFVLTSINGRTETRTYAKGVAAGASEHELSPEEQQAIGYATRDVGRRSEVVDVPDPAARRRTRA